jgi:hypothetical protein
MIVKDIGYLIFKDDLGDSGAIEGVTSLSDCLQSVYIDIRYSSTVLAELVSSRGVAP